LNFFIWWEISMQASCQVNSSLCFILFFVVCSTLIYMHTDSISSIILLLYIYIYIYASCLNFQITSFDNFFRFCFFLWKFFWTFKIFEVLSLHIITRVKYSYFVDTEFAESSQVIRRGPYTKVRGTVLNFVCRW
jgi:hypothetical protein